MILNFYTFIFRNFANISNDLPIIVHLSGMDWYYLHAFCLYNLSRLLFPLNLRSFVYLYSSNGISDDHFNRPFVSHHLANYVTSFLENYRSNSFILGIESQMM